MDFSDFNLDAVNDILSTLSQSDVENLSKMAAQMFASQNADSGQSKKEEGEEKAKGGFSFDDIPFDPDSMMKIFNLMNKLKKQPEDQRVKLLYALRPMLTERRRHKVDEAVQMMKIMAILPLLRE